MTRFAIDASTARRLLDEARPVSAAHELVAPSSLRPQVLDMLYRESGGAERDAAARDRLDRLAALKIRVLGDRVSRAVAWQLAAQLGWDSIGPAEYLAVASLQADALITTDALLRQAAEGVTRLAEYEELFA